MSYTKGIWQVEIEDDKGNCTINIDGIEYPFVQTFRNRFAPHIISAEESVANAHLISASPEMHEALQATILLIKTFNEMLMRHEPDSAIVGVVDALLDDPIFDKALAKIEGKVTT